MQMKQNEPIPLQNCNVLSGTTKAAVMRYDAKRRALRDQYPYNKNAGDETLCKVNQPRVG